MLPMSIRGNRQNITIENGVDIPNILIILIIYGKFKFSALIIPD